jgi:type I restriction enzyme S subunit
LKRVTVKIGSGATPVGGSEGYLPTRAGFALVRSQNVLDRAFEREGLAFISDQQADRLRGVALQPGDVLLNITGDGVTFGRACAIPNDVLPACVNQHVAIIRVNPKLVEPGFVLAFLTHPDVKPYIEAFNAGGSRRAITKAHIESFQLPIPPLEEQRAMASVLGALDDKIDLNRRMNETLEEMARALFKSWFVDFDPVHAKAAGKKPFGMDDSTAALFPSRFSGPTPEGWDYRSLDTFLELLTDGAHESPPSVELGRPMASVKDLTPWGIDLSSVRSISASDFERLVSNGCNPRPGDVLLAKDGARCLETVCEYRQTADVVLLSSIAILRPRSTTLSGFVRIWLALPETRAYLREGFRSGSAIPRVVLKDLKRALLVSPSAGILDVFDRVTGGPRSQIQKNAAEIDALSALRDALLPKLLSGELRLKDAERIVGEVT